MIDPSSLHTRSLPQRPNPLLLHGFPKIDHPIGARFRTVGRLLIIDKAIGRHFVQLQATRGTFSGFHLE
jgi:hypothetical protein